MSALITAHHISVSDVCETVCMKIFMNIRLALWKALCKHGYFSEIMAHFIYLWNANKNDQKRGEEKKLEGKMCNEMYS